MSAIDNNTAAVETATPLEANDTDLIAQNRLCPVLEAESVPKPPAGFRPSAPEKRQRLLRRVDKDHVPLVEKSLEACAARGEKIVEDLGKLAPRPEKAAQLAARLKKLQRLKTAAAYLSGYVEELEEIALSDATQFLEGVRDGYEVMVTADPDLALLYEPLTQLFRARGEKISEGRARAKARREAEAAAARAAREQAYAEKGDEKK
jgi:hypothetical protein